MNPIGSLTLLAWVSAAWGGTGDLDAHGPVPPAGSGDPAVPLRSFSPLSHGGAGAGVLGELATEPLVLQTREGGETTTDPKIAQVWLANVGGYASFGPAGLAVTVPVVLASAPEGPPALGDALIAAPVALVPADRFGLSLVPFARLPTGPSGRYLGDAGFGGGGLVAAVLDADALVIHASGGAEARAVSADPLAPGGPYLLGSGALGWRITDDLAAHAEVVASARLERSDPAVPIEATGAVRGRAGSVWWAVGAGSGLTGGEGAAAVRAFAGIGWTRGRAEREITPVVEQTGPEPDTVAPAAPVARVATVTVRDVRGEAVPATVTFVGSDGTVVGEADGTARWSATLTEGAWTLAVAADGYGTQRRSVGAGDVEAVLLPHAGDATLALSLADLGGEPIAGARVLVDGLPAGATGSGGDLVLEGLAAGPHEVEVRGHGYRTVQARVALPPGGTAEERVAMPSAVGALRVVVRGEDGPVTDAWVAFEGPSRRHAVALGEGGARSFVLAPGRWTAVVTSEAAGMQAREIVLTDDAWTEAVAEFVLLRPESGPADLALRVVDPDGLPVEGVEITLDGRTVGPTATGGSIVVHDLGEGARKVRVSGPHVEPVERQVLLLAGLQEEILTVRWAPGTTRVRARTPDGPVTDAVLSGSGPGKVAPTPLGPTGREVVALSPGEWRLVVASAAHGLATRTVVVPEGGRLAEADFVLLPASPGGGLGDVAVRVRDPLGAPVDGARVRLDGVDRGATQSGRLDLVGLVPGQRSLDVAADAFRPATRAVGVKSGPQQVEVPLAWTGGAVRVRVTDGEGPVQDAVVRLFGAGVATPPVEVAADGSRVVPVAAGRWQVVVASETRGIGTAGVEVASGAGVMDVDLRIGASDGSDLLVLVQDPLGRPVGDATVRCDGCAVTGPAAGGAIQLHGLEPGKTMLEVSAPDHKPRRVEATVHDGDHQRLVQLDPVPGRVRVAVADEQGRPLDAEVRFVGPWRMPATLLGEVGEQEISVMPGRWQVTAVAPGYGAQRRDLVIESGGEPSRIDLTLYPAKVTVTASEVVIGEQVHFDLGKAALRPDSNAILREVANTLIAQPELVLVEIQGHTDATGDIALNQRLSEDRAMVVREALIAMGVPSDRLVARGYGPTQPVAPNADDAGRQRNRRVQFEIVEVSRGD